MIGTGRKDERKVRSPAQRHETLVALGSRICSRTKQSVISLVGEREKRRGREELSPQFPLRPPHKRVSTALFVLPRRIHVRDIVNVRHLR